jgi:hypothetical protein
MKRPINTFLTPKTILARATFDEAGVRGSNEQSYGGTIFYVLHPFIKEYMFALFKKIKFALKMYHLQSLSSLISLPPIS